MNSADVYAPGFEQAFTYLFLAGNHHTKLVQHCFTMCREHMRRRVRELEMLLRKDGASIHRGGLYAAGTTAVVRFVPRGEADHLTVEIDTRMRLRTLTEAHQIRFASHFNITARQ